MSRGVNIIQNLINCKFFLYKSTCYYLLKLCVPDPYSFIINTNCVEHKLRKFIYFFFKLKHPKFLLIYIHTPL